MKEIEKQFQKWGDTWTLKKRVGNITIYHRHGRNGTHWEVLRVHIRTEPRPGPGGSTLRAGEFFKMSDNHYGTHAWCFQTQEEANKKLTALVG